MTDRLTIYGPARKPRPGLGQVGSLRQTLAEIWLYAMDDDPDRTLARLKARAIATPWNAPLLDAYLAQQQAEVDA